MKKLILIIFIFISSHCSFDNKSGIWTNSNKVDLKKIDRFKDFETLYTKEKSFNEIIAPNKKYSQQDRKVIEDEVLQIDLAHRKAQLQVIDGGKS